MTKKRSGRKEEATMKKKAKEAEEAVVKKSSKREVTTKKRLKKDEAVGRRKLWEEPVEEEKADKVEVGMVEKVAEAAHEEAPAERKVEKEKQPQEAVDESVQPQAQPTSWKDCSEVKHLFVEVADGNIQLPDGRLLPKSSNAARQVMSEQARYERKCIMETKKEVFQLEKKNRSSIYLMRSTGGWWKMGGASALMYVNLVAPKLGLKPKLQGDRDFQYRFRDGVVSVKSFDALKRSLETEGIFLKDTYVWHVRFELPYEISDDQLESIRHQKDKYVNEVNRIIMPRNLMPELYSMIRQLNVEITTKVGQLEDVTRELVGLDLVRLGFQMTQGVFALEHNEMSEAAFFKRVAEEVNKIICRVAELMDSERMDTKKGLKLIRGVEQVRKMAQVEEERRRGLWSGGRVAQGNNNGDGTQGGGEVVQDREGNGGIRRSEKGA